MTLFVSDAGMTRALTLPTLRALTKKRRPARALRRVRAKVRRGWAEGTEPRCLPLSGLDLNRVLVGSEAYASEVILRMCEQSETWRPGMDGVDPVQGVMLDEKREVFLHPVDLQIAQAATMLTLQPHLARVFEPLNYAFRPRRSNHDALFAARAYSRKLPFAAKADIRKFFDHTTADKVLSALEVMLPELGTEWSRWIAYLMSSSVYRLGPDDVGTRGFMNPTWTPESARPHPGVIAGTAPTFERQPMVVLQGSVLGPMLANIVGHAMIDVPLRSLRPEVMCLRYADDMLLLGKTAGHVEEALDVLHLTVAKWEYQLHPEKTSTGAVDLSQTSMPWLGKELSKGSVRTPDEWVEHRVAEALAFPARSTEARKAVRMLLRELRLDPRAGFDDVVAAVSDRSIDHYLLIEDLFPKVKQSRAAWLRASNRKMITL